MTQTQPPFLSVIIPAYNEEQRIGATLESVYSYLERQPYRWEMLIVIDGATDGTLEKVRSFGQERNNVRWIDRRENRGKGYTVRQGMLAATGAIRLFTDADNSTDIAHWDKMQPLFDQGYDVVICSRDSKDVPGARQAVPQPFRKRLLGNLGNLFIQIVAVPGIWDTQCGFKAFTKEAAEKIFPLMQIDRWGFDVEALALARRFNYSIGIVAAYWIDDPRTNVRSFGDYVDSIRETLRVRWNLLTGVYARTAHASTKIDAA
ncbi:MAG: glycosyltransferase family 2 protein [Caldilineaceae bacterium]